MLEGRLDDSRRAFHLGAALAARRRERKIPRAVLSRRSRVAAWTLADYEAGERLPSPEELDRLAECLGTTAARLRDEGEMLAAIREVPPWQTFDRAMTTLSTDRDFRAALVVAAREFILPAARPCTEEAGPERRLAETSWKRLANLNPEAQRAAIDRNRIFRRWGLAERLCRESESSTGSARALELAELAHFVAERVGGAPAWRSHLRGYALAYLAKTKLAGGDRSGAEEAIRRGRALWNPEGQEETDLLKWPEMPGL